MRLIGADGNQVGIVAIEEALAKAEQADLDLVEIAPQAMPPVCKIMDYGKYLFEQGKKQKKKAKHIHVKVKYLEETLLTTQFYFAGDERLEADTIFDEDGESLILDPQPADNYMTATMPIIVPEQ